MKDKLFQVWRIIGKFYGSGKEVKISRCVTMLVLIFGLLLSGCIGNESMSGKYVSTTDNQTYFNLYEDGTFNYFYSRGSIPSESGTYRIVDGKLLLTFQPWGGVVPFTKNQSSWIRERGDTYVKK